MDYVTTTIVLRSQGKDDSSFSHCIIVTGPASWIYDQHSHTGFYFQKSCTWSLMLCNHHLKFLMVLSLNLCFLNEVQWDSGACTGTWSLSPHMSPLLPPLWLHGKNSGQPTPPVTLSPTLPPFLVPTPWSLPHSTQGSNRIMWWVEGYIPLVALHSHQRPGQESQGESELLESPAVSREGARWWSSCPRLAVPHI